MLNDGLALMSVGMGTVFSFLVILWISVTIMGKVVAQLNKLFPEEVKTAPVAVKSASQDVEVAIAIAAAKLSK
jgi:sodium pump decarboxylase gamma subunit